MRTALYPGSFDPPTKGHLDIIARAARLVDRLVVAVGVHHGKTPLLSASERVELLESEIAARLPGGDAVSVTTFDNLVVDAARTAGADILIRGLRNGTDFDYEFQLAGMNAAMASEIETVFLAASPGNGLIASSVVKQIAGLGGDISGFVPAGVERVIKQKLDR